MRKQDTQKGFTLVELAIVMTIIGLLIGGILKGQELMENARVTATIAQVKAYEAAITTFRDSYNAVPGDMPAASTRIPRCPATACDPWVASTGAGNTVVGDSTWASTLAWAAQVPTGGMLLTHTAAGDETGLFWVHLLLADLISGVTDQTVQTASVPPSWTITHPAARIGGGFVVGQGNNSVPPGSTVTTPAGSGPTGMILALTNSPISTLPGGAVAANGIMPLTAARAAQIDRKVDDGRPAGGYVQAFGVSSSCFNSATNAGTASYLEANAGRDCGLIFRIQG